MKVRLGAVCVMLMLPFLQGAGCRSHYSARLKGTVTVPEGTEFPPDVRIIYRKYDEKTQPCRDDWSPCLKTSTWLPLRKCNGKVEDSIVSKIEDRRNEFDACTAQIGEDYAADLIAFVDLDHDAVLDPGERYGAWKGNPLTRTKEKGPLSLEFELDRTLP